MSIAIIPLEGCFWQICFCAFRFGIGRFTTEEEIDYTAEKCIRHVKRLREMRWVCIAVVSVRMYAVDTGLWDFNIQLRCIATSCSHLLTTLSSVCTLGGIESLQKSATAVSLQPTWWSCPLPATFYHFIFNCPSPCFLWTTLSPSYHPLSSIALPWAMPLGTGNMHAPVISILTSLWPEVLSLFCRAALTQW